MSDFYEDDEPLACIQQARSRPPDFVTAPPHGSAQRAATGCTCELCTIARAYVADQGDDVVILCPWCGDWEDLWEIGDQLATGRFWCCWMCDQCPDRAWPRD
jgi:hypothetical protein